jgi:transketolase
MHKKQKESVLRKTGEKVRRLILEMSFRSHSGETGSALSISDILSVLYFSILRVNPKKPDDPKRDRFVLSKGHGAAALYAVLALRGYFPQKKLLEYRTNGGEFHSHPSQCLSLGIEASTGSLGQGLSIAAGMALALQKTDSKVYVLLGDGECNEGSVWEAALFIGNARLPNIVVIIDDNKFQGFGATKETNRFDLAKQWRAFGWKTFTVDGHNPRELERVLLEAKNANVPVVVIADTVAGKGVTDIEHTLQAHYYVANKIDLGKKKIKR